GLSSSTARRYAGVDLAAARADILDCVSHVDRAMTGDDSHGKALCEASLADGRDVLQKLHWIKRGWVSPPGLSSRSRRIARREIHERFADFLVRAGPEQVDLAR